MGISTQTLVRRTPDVVVIIVLGFAGLLIGREVLDWYRQPAPVAEPAPQAFADLNTPGLPVGLEFGDSPVNITRVVIVGTRDDSRTALADLMASLLPTAMPLEERPDDERSVLTTLTRRPPFAEQRGEWRIYGVDDQSLMMVLVRPAERVNARSLPASRPRLAPGDDAVPDKLSGTDLANWRIVAWGFALGTTEDAWSLYTFHGTGRRSDPDADGRGNFASGADLPDPPGAVRNMRLRDPSGATITGMTGEGSLDRAADFYQQKLTAAGYLGTPGWRAHPSHRWGRFRRPASVSPGLKPTDVEILLTIGEANRWSGLVTTIERTEGSAEKAPE